MLTTASRRPAANITTSGSSRVWGISFNQTQELVSRQSRSVWGGPAFVFFRAALSLERFPASGWLPHELPAGRRATVAAGFRQTWFPYRHDRPGRRPSIASGVVA